MNTVGLIVIVLMPALSQKFCYALWMGVPKENLTYFTVTNTMALMVILINALFHAIMADLEMCCKIIDLVCIKKILNLKLTHSPLYENKQCQIQYCVKTILEFNEG